MKIGTRSILFGYHQFLLHPLIVAVAWWRLYGFPADWRLWLAFFLHDIGYWSCNDMDGKEGLLHPYRGAELMFRWFGREWEDLTLFHSRDMAKQWDHKISRLCIADKLAGCMYPNWLAIGLCKLSGELCEYMERFNRASPKEWAEQYRVETLKWIELNYNEASYQAGCLVKHCK